MNLVHFLLLCPFYLIGWLIGYFYRATLRGFYGGWFHIELQQRTALTNELSNIVKNMKEINDDES